MIYRKKQERQNIIWQLSKTILRKPHCIRQPEEDLLAFVNQWNGAKESVAKSVGVRLPQKENETRADTPTVILHDIRFARRNDETNLGRPAANHSLHEVFTDGARALDIPVQP